LAHSLWVSSLVKTNKKREIQKRKSQQWGRGGKKFALILVLLENTSGVELSCFSHLLDIWARLGGLQQTDKHLDSLASKQRNERRQLTAMTHPSAGIPSAIPVRWFARTLSLRNLSCKMTNDLSPLFPHPVVISFPLFLTLNACESLRFWEVGWSSC